MPRPARRPLTGLVPSPAAVPVGACALLWVDALAGGRLAGTAPVLLVVATAALVAGLRTPLPWLVTACAAAALLIAVADQTA